MADPFESYAATAMGYGTKGSAITADDSTDLDPVAKAVVVTSVSGGTNLVVLPSGNADGATVTFTGVSVGFIPPYRVRRVYATGTTCSVASVDG